MNDRVFTARLILVVCLWAGIVGLQGFADTKSEADLKARLAASESARATAEKEKAALATTLSKLAASRATATDAVKTASKTAQQNSGELLNTAQDSYALALRALTESTSTAQGVRDQSQKLQETIERNSHSANLSQVYILVGGILAFCGTWIVAMRDRRWARKDAEDARELAAEVAKSQGGKLDQIHTLVNSSMTAALVSELDARRRDLVSLQEIMSLHDAAGTKPTQEALRVITTAKHDIAELEASLDDRVKSTAIATAELKKSEKI